MEGGGLFEGGMLIDMHRVRTLARAQCRCRGSCAFVHVACLQRWLQCRPANAGSLAAYNNVSATRRDVSEAVAPHCEVRAWTGQGLPFFVPSIVCSLRTYHE
jgi:hypothetical protein